MTGEEAVRFYHALQRFGIQPGLERIRALCAKLGDPQDRLRFVHVAGTNGKGSVCTELAFTRYDITSTSEQKKIPGHRSSLGSRFKP